MKKPPPALPTIRLRWRYHQTDRNCHATRIDRSTSRRIDTEYWGGTRPILAVASRPGVLVLPLPQPLAV